MSASVTITFKTKRSLGSLQETRGYDEKERKAFESLSLFKKLALKKLNPQMYEYLKNTSSEFTENTHKISGKIFLEKEHQKEFLKNLQNSLDQDELIYRVDYGVTFNDN